MNDKASAIIIVGTVLLLVALALVVDPRMCIAAVELMVIAATCGVCFSVVRKIIQVYQRTKSEVPGGIDTTPRPTNDAPQPRSLLELFIIFLCVLACAAIFSYIIADFWPVN